jgi:polar amino acid transport system substrate-binding protein
MKSLLRPFPLAVWTALAIVAVPAFLVATRPVPLSVGAAPRTATVAGDVADLSRQAQLTPQFQMVPHIHAMLPADIRASGRMTVAMSVGIAPLNFPGEAAEEVKGLMPDLASALQQVLGVSFEPTIYPSTASQLLALDSGRVQLAVSTNSDTLEREGRYDFINYLVAGDSLVMQAADKGRLKEIAQLCGKSFGEVKGAVSLLPMFEQTCREKHLPPPVLASFDDAPSMMLALASRRVSSFVGSPFNTIYLRSQGVAVTDIPLPQAGHKVLGMTVSKRNPAITAAVMAAMETLVANDYYSQSLNRWGLGAYAMAPRVNLAGPASSTSRPTASRKDDRAPTLPRHLKGTS